MATFKMGNKNYKIIPFLITTGTLIFFVFWIGGLGYKYHLETEERRKLQEVDIIAKAKELNNVIYEEIKKLKQENEHLKSVPYEFIRENGEKEYYNLFTHQLVKKIDNDNNIFEYDKNNGMLLKKTDKYHNITEYGSHEKRIKETLSNGVWTEFNPVNDKMVKRKNIDNSIEEFDDNEEKFKEIDKNGKVKFFKTQLYQTVSDFKKLSADIFQLKDAGFTTKQLKDAGFVDKKIIYLNDKKTIHYINEYDLETGNIIKQTVYDTNNNFKTISYINEYNPETGELIKETYYKLGGKIIKRISEYDPTTGKFIKQTQYNPDGTVKKIINS